MNVALTDLERYMNEGDDYDPLIRIALIHYQFETIHPFLDGNGRVGRLMILLYLMEQGYISKPIIYILFSEKNQIEYYDRISEVRRVFDYIEQYPIIEIKRTAADLGVSYNTVSSAVDKLVQTGILKETTNASRNRVFSYEEYLNILRKGT